MHIDPIKVGAQIAALRKGKKYTQSDLGERLNISFQAVSKWERGEALPDTSILMALAQTLDTTVDNILLGGEKMMAFKGKLTVKDMQEGIRSLERMGYLLGRNNPLYRYAIEGMSERLNIDVAETLENELTRECLILEAIIQNMVMGYYFDPADVKANFKQERLYHHFCDYAKKYQVL